MTWKRSCSFKRFALSVFPAKRGNCQWTVLKVSSREFQVPQKVRTLEFCGTDASLPGAVQLIMIKLDLQ